MRSLIDILDLSTREIDELIATATDIIENPDAYSRKCEGRKLATLFFEPSTRTRLSFEAAMYELGGHVLSVSSVGGSSVAKGESIADTARTVNCYADIIALRHPQEGAALVAAQNVPIPVINAGDGGHCHPTQTLADLLTIYREKGHFDNLTVGMCGDLINGRTVHSLIAALSRYPGVKFVLISPEELRLPRNIIRRYIDANGIPYKEVDSLDEVLPELDALYMTRIQKERFDDMVSYDRLKGRYILSEEKMQLAKADCIVMHPLPRVDEIAVEVDEDPRACYFKQVQNGKYMRMALILKLLTEAGDNPVKTGGRHGIKRRYHCTNPKCICSVEPGLDQEVIQFPDGTLRCAYCDARIEE